MYGMVGFGVSYDRLPCLVWSVLNSMGGAVGCHGWCGRLPRLVRLVDMPCVVGFHGWCGRLPWLVRSAAMSGAAGGHAWYGRLACLIQLVDMPGVVRSILMVLSVIMVR